MVKGLDVFRRHFERYSDQFILIGGTAATLTMEEAGLEFRATKDLDIVLHIEALQPAFGRACGSVLPLSTLWLTLLPRLKPTADCWTKRSAVRRQHGFTTK